MLRYISERVKWKVATWLLICIPVFKQTSVCQWQILDFAFKNILQSPHVAMPSVKT